MTSIDIVERLTGHILKHGGHEKRRYLGMSQIHRAEKEILQEMQIGTPTPQPHQGLIFALGYDFERIMLAKLEAAGVVIPKSGRTLIAKFDKRFIGHTDAECVDGALCEIKSTVELKLAKIEQESKVPNAHYVQAQMYMHHGGYARDMIVYVARDTGRVHVRSVRYDPKTAATYNEKAKRILATIDNYQ